MRKNDKLGARKKFKKGAASYYIVAFSTLILVVIATSFAMVTISEISRSSNDDLSQSAYDSALAGVEDAKIAFSNYRRCKEAQLKGSNIGDVEFPLVNSRVSTCGQVIKIMENISDEYRCYMVAYILGKMPYGKTDEVIVGGNVTTVGGEETSSTNQAYTCVQINTNLRDYRATLSANTLRRTIKASVDGYANDVNKIRFSWYSVRSDLTSNILNYGNFSESGAKVTFKPLNSGVATPPTVELQILQTGPTFTMASFDSTDNGTTNRATLYLVPTKASSNSANSANYVWKGTSAITASEVVRTNSRTVSNKPFVISCDGNATGEFYCSTEIELPKPAGGGPRNDDTFIISVALPYQNPDTDFAIELICGSNTQCGAKAGASGNGEVVGNMSNTQISIDSTGRANDLYRRVETRMETTDTTFGFNSPYYALEILGSGAVSKNLTVTSEYDFYF